jgi:hypothetical protein
MPKSKHFAAFVGMITTLVFILLSKTVNGLYRPSDIGLCLFGGFCIFGITALFQWVDDL